MDKFCIIFTVHFLTNHKLYTNDYEPPEDGLVKAETYVGVEE
jgi:hypothetical protein